MYSVIPDRVTAMEEDRGQDDSIVFPDDDYSMVTEYEVTTVKSKNDSNSNVTVIVIVILSIIFILIVGVIILYKKYTKSKAKSKKENPLISLPTLGTQYELASLLTINTVGRKSSETSNQASEDIDKYEDVFDGRVSKYIDASTIEMNKAEEYIADYTLKNILDVTTDERLGSSQSFSLQPPHAVPENSTSRPISLTEELNSISIIGGSRPITRILEEQSDSSLSSPDIPAYPSVTPASPSVIKTRPKSEHVEAAPPLLPAKGKLMSATSEMLMPTLCLVPPSPSSSRSESSLAPVPPVPPKARPGIPPKQKINKSREDMVRIDKEILRVSSKNITLGQAGYLSKNTKDGEDVDYDFPTNPGDDNDDEEYDEPCPLLPQPDLHEQLDYDDPVQKYT